MKQNKKQKIYSFQFHIFEFLKLTQQRDNIIT